ncbi:ABC transporter [Alkalispirochaeta sphaeroplastigenens]|uniref:ABC transporter n=1 Tax=Alkalispirochaeta sphaeroplastigenens TaxID=1187066 RepID=A0A2S4JLK9_9SPIO|nr:ABC transporter [Alkalispirochaeta sphaeroplastigenens]
MSKEQSNTNLPEGSYSKNKAKNAKKTTFRLYKDLMGQKWKLMLTLLGVAVSSLLGILYPLLLAQAIDLIADGIHTTVSTQTDFIININTMGAIMLALVFIFFIRGIFGYMQQYVLASVAQNVSLTMRKRISEKLNKLPLHYYDTHKKGDILSRVTSDLEKVANTLQDGVSQLLSSLVGIIGALVVMFMISPFLSLIVLGTVFLSLVITVMFSKKTQLYHAENQKALGAMNAHIEEAFTGNMVIKAFNMQSDVIQETDSLNENLCNMERKAQFITYVINPIIQFMNNLGYVVIAIGGAILVLSGGISIGYIQAFLQYINKVSESVTTFAYVSNSLQGAIAAAERVYQIQDELEEVPDKHTENILSVVKGDIRFEDVRFGYQDDEILMDKINIDVKAGSKIAIVGPTGAGKTTLVNLLMRFYELHSGKITIDGIDIKDMSRNELHSIIGMVLQDTWLFSGTIAENIAYGKKNASVEEIKQAAEAARIDHFIRTLPHGYQTILDDEVSSISVGQKQLITIARAILANPAILILDEATSSVDTRTEIEIQKAMATLMKNRTSFIIAHRLSTIRDADHILVMDKGNIIEQGTHRELITENGFYADLYTSQFSSQIA